MSNSDFPSLVGVPVGNVRSVVGIKICAISAGIKKYKSIVKKKRKKYNKIMFLGKAKLDTIKVLISNALIDAHIRLDEFVSINKVFRESNEMKEKFKNLQNAVELLYKNDGNVLCQL